jgi:hypothetical protein
MVKQHLAATRDRYCGRSDVDTILIDIIAIVDYDESYRQVNSR